MSDQSTELLRSSKTRGEGNLLREGILSGLRKASEHRGLHDTRSDGVDTDAVGGEFTSHGKSEGDNTTLGSGVGSLSDLAFVCSDGGSVDDDTALAHLVGVLGCHGVGGEAGNIEGADEVDVDSLGEDVEGVRALLADDLGGGADTGARDGTVEGLELVVVELDGVVDFVSGSDVGLDELAVVGAEFGDDLVAEVLIHVEDGDLGVVLGDEVAGDGFTEARSATSDEDGTTREVAEHILGDALVYFIFL